MMRVFVLMVCVYLSAAFLLYEASETVTSSDALMTQFLRLPAQDRADFMSANLTPDMLMLLRVTPCDKP